MLRKKMTSFRLRFEIIEMLETLSKELSETKTRIIEMLIEEVYFRKKNRMKPK